MTNDKTNHQIEQSGVDLFNGVDTGDVAATLTHHTEGVGSGPYVRQEQDVAATLTKHYHKGLTTTPEDGELIIQNGYECYDPAQCKKIDVSQTVVGDHNDRVTDYGTLVSNSSHPVVRRLTPLECERLMGLWDGYTLIPNLVFKWGKGVKRDNLPLFPKEYSRVVNEISYRCVLYRKSRTGSHRTARIPVDCFDGEPVPEKYPVEGKGYWRLKWRKIDWPEAHYIIENYPEFSRFVRLDGTKWKTCLVSDGPRYKACGNGWAVNSARWVLQRMNDFIQTH